MRNPFVRRRAPRPFESAPQSEVEDELAFHVERRIADYVAQGMSAEAARAAALERFGDLGRVQSECTQLLEADRRAAERRDWFDDLRQDLRFGVRALLKSPVFTLLAIVTLGLGIGANAAVFGVVKSVLLDALPYADADRLVRVYGMFRDYERQRGPLSAGTVAEIRARQRSLERLGAFQSATSDAVFGGEDGPRPTKVSWVEPEVFRTLGVSPSMGRPFQPDDVADTARVVLVSHAAWRVLFGADPGVLGRDIRIDGLPRTVIGVMPRDFVGVASGAGDAEFYFPLSLDPVLRDPVNARRSYYLGLIGRLAPGITVEAADRELAAIGDALSRAYPDENASIGVAAVPIRNAMAGHTRTPLLVLMASAGLVLLIACANLAGALLSRTLSRQKEFAVRVAIGAGRGRLVRQLLTESLLLASAGGAAGLLVATLILGALRGLASAALPDHANLTLDPGVMLLMAGVAIGTGLAFGLAPALSVGRTDPQQTLRLESRGASESLRSRQLRGLLVAGQIALCISVLAGAGLLTRSLWAMMEAPLGFRPDGVLTARVSLPDDSYGTDESISRFLGEYAERLRSLPGVTAVGSVSQLPTRVTNRVGVGIEGAPEPPDDAQPFILFSAVSDDYFRVLGIPLLRGRTFGPHEQLAGPNAMVISEAFARRYFSNREALGARMRIGRGPEAPLWTIVGIVGDVRNDPTAEAEPWLYASQRQVAIPTAAFLVTAAVDPASLVRPMARELAALDPDLPLDRPMLFTDVLDEGLAGRRLPVLLMLGFGVLSLVLSSVGVYALFAAMAVAREREFGVRVALGATRAGIAWLVLRQGGVWMLLGLLGGAAGVVAVVRAVRGMLVGVPPFDPVALGAAVAALMACGVVALLAPLRRAMRADPIEVMR